MRSVGVREFGGYADLILFDAWLRGEKVELDFTRAMHIDLAEAIAKQRILNIGGFLQSLIDTVDLVREHVGKDASNVVERISDKLGLAVGKASLTEYLIEKWGRVIGAPKLLALATGHIGRARSPIGTVMPASQELPDPDHDMGERELLAFERRVLKVAGRYTLGGDAVVYESCVDWSSISASSHRTRADPREADDKHKLWLLHPVIGDRD